VLCNNSPKKLFLLCPVRLCVESHLFAAALSAGGGVAGEHITVHAIPLAGVSDWLAAQAQTGRLIDPKVYAGLYFVTSSR